MQKIFAKDLLGLDVIDEILDDNEVDGVRKFIGSSFEKLAGEREQKTLKQRRASAATTKINVTGTYFLKANRITYFRSLRSPYVIVALWASRCRGQ